MTWKKKEILALIQQILPSRQFSDIEQRVFYQSWLGKRYDQMAEELGYDTGYLRVVGSRLWKELSEVVGQPINKHNIRSILREQQKRILSNSQLITPPKPTPNSQSKAEFPGSLVSSHSPFYIERPPIESSCYAEILQPSAVIRIKAPKKMGKSSLLKAILDYAHQQGYYTLRLNLQQADNDAFSTIHFFLRWFCKTLAWKLNLDVNLDEHWETEPGFAKSNCMRFVERFILRSFSQPFVLGLDALDRLFNYPQVAKEFLPLLRVWHEEAHESEVWENMRLVLVQSTDVYPILNIYQSPFNIGLPITLPEFTLEQVQCLAQRYGFKWDNQAKDLMAIVGGHPYLIQLALYHLADQKTSFTELLKYAPTESGIYANHLRRQLHTLQEKPELLTAMKEVVESEQPVIVKREIAYQLKSMGLVKRQGNKIIPSCQLYYQYFQ